MKQLTVISRWAPFDLVKVQKGLVHGRHVIRGQTIVFCASFLFIMPLIPTTSLGQPEKLQGFFSLLIIPGILCPSPKYVLYL